MLDAGRWPSLGSNQPFGLQDRTKEFSEASAELPLPALFSRTG
jgi:hypothetical protein